MSRKSKGIDTDKILDQLSNVDLDDQVSFFHKYKEQLDAALLARANELGEQQNKYLEIKDQINKNAK